MLQGWQVGASSADPCSPPRGGVCERSLVWASAQVAWGQCEAERGQP